MLHDPGQILRTEPAEPDPAAGVPGGGVSSARPNHAGHRGASALRVLVPQQQSHSAQRHSPAEDHRNSGTHGGDHPDWTGLQD